MYCKFFAPPRSCQRGSPHNTIAVVEMGYNPGTGRDEVVGWHCPKYNQASCSSFEDEQSNLPDVESGMDRDTYPEKE